MPPSRPGVRRSGPFSGIPDERHRRAARRIGERERLPVQSWHAQHGDVVLRVERDDLRVEDAGIDAVDARRVDPRDDVGVRDDEAGPRDPAGALDAEPARDACHPHDAPRGARDVRVPREPGIGRGDDRGRAEEHADRVDALERLEQSLRREDLVDLTEDRRPLHGPTQVGLPGEVEQHRTDRPAEEDARREPQREAGEPVEQPHAGDEAEARTKRGGEHAGESAHDRPEQDGARERDDGHVGRAVREDERREPRTEVRAEREPGEREGSAEEAGRDPIESGRRRRRR